MLCKSVGRQSVNTDYLLCTGHGLVEEHFGRAIDGVPWLLSDSFVAKVMPKLRFEVLVELNSNKSGKGQ